MSIDCLLDRTIKYMLFLQSVTKHAETLKKADKIKVTFIRPVDLTFILKNQMAYSSSK